MRVRFLALIGLIAGAAVGTAQGPPPSPTPSPSTAVDPESDLAREIAAQSSAFRSAAAPEPILPSIEALINASIPAPGDDLTAGIRRDSETCRLIRLLHACRLRSLEAKKRKWEEISGRLTSLETLYKSIRDEEFVSKELLDRVAKEVAEAKQTAEAPGVKFTSGETLELAVLQRNQTYVTALCERNATPSAYYNLKVGAEGFWRDGSPTDGFATVDFTFLNPAWLRAKLKFLVLELPTPFCGAVTYRDLLRSSDRIRPTFEILRADRKDFSGSTRGCRVSLRDVFLERAGAVTQAARDQLEQISGQEKCEKAEEKSAKADLDKVRKDIADRESALVALLERIRNKKIYALTELGEQLDKLDRARKRLEELQEEAKLHDSNLESLGRQRAQISGTAPLCTALAHFEELMDRLMLRLEEPARKALLFSRPRVGPYVLPDPLEVAIAPIWFNARLATEPVPDPTKRNETGDPLFDNDAMPVVSFGLQKLWNIRGSAVILGPYAGAGTVLGTLPGEHPNETASRRTFFDLGLYSQTQYRVSASDAAAKTRDVVGSLYLGYRRANYLERGDPKLERSELPINSADRAIVELRLKYEMGGEQTVKPFIYVTIDRSAGGSKKLARDRMGIAFDIDLKKAFAPFGKALGISEMAPPNPTP